MNLFWQNKNTYVHKVKPPKMKPRDENGYLKFLRKKAIYNLTYIQELIKDLKDEKDIQELIDILKEQER